jgi:hypothetical protein
MKLPTFRRDPAAGLATAQAALTATEQRIAELEGDRQTALAESDTLEAVALVDSALTKERAAAATYQDRIQVLRGAVKAANEDERQKQYSSALAIVAKRLEARAALAAEMEAALKHTSELWAKLMASRSDVMAKWPEVLPLPRIEDLAGTELRLELAYALYAAGKPNWERPGWPNPLPAPGVQGMEPKGIAEATRLANEGFLARLKSLQSIKPDQDEEEAA